MLFTTATTNTLEVGKKEMRNLVMKTGSVAFSGS